MKIENYDMYKMDMHTSSNVVHPPSSNIFKIKFHSLIFPTTTILKLLTITVIYNMEKFNIKKIGLRVKLYFQLK